MSYTHLSIIERSKLEILHQQAQAQPGDEVEWAGTNWTVGEITTTAVPHTFTWGSR